MQDKSTFTINGHCVIMAVMRKPKLHEFVGQWLNDYESGLSTRQIAKQYKVSCTTVSKYLKERITLRSRAEMQAGHRNSNWKGDNVGIWGLHKWLRANLPKPALCENCNEQPPFDVANIEPTYNAKTYTRVFAYWRWLCRKCHMKIDGRALTNKRGIAL